MSTTPAHTDDWVDAQEMGRNRPGTFGAPTADELRRIKVGDFVKICNGLERFWVCVTFIDAFTHEDPADCLYRGAVSNQLLGGRRYNFGDLVEFRGRHAYATTAP